MRGSKADGIVVDGSKASDMLESLLRKWSVDKLPRITRHAIFEAIQRKFNFKQAVCTPNTLKQELD
jgi:hypothetical protein